jgi:hypothetical protein
VLLLQHPTELNLHNNIWLVTLPLLQTYLPWTLKTHTASDPNTLRIRSSKASLVLRNNTMPGTDALLEPAKTPKKDTGVVRVVARLPVERAAEAATDINNLKRLDSSLGRDQRMLPTP